MQWCDWFYTYRTLLWAISAHLTLHTDFGNSNFRLDLIQLRLISFDQPKVGLFRLDSDQSPRFLSRSNPVISLYSFSHLEGTVSIERSGLNDLYVIYRFMRVGLPEAVLRSDLTRSLLYLKNELGAT